MHIVCGVRPEIRDIINDQDAEINKVFDGKSVTLSWDMGNDDDSILFRLMKQKVIHSSGKVRVVSFDEFVTKSVSFGGNINTLEKFLHSNTSWIQV